MKNRDISLKFEELLRVSNKEQRKIINSFKKDLLSTFDKVNYESNYNKYIHLPNSNKLENDIKELEKNNIYLLFIHIPNLVEKYIDDKEKLSLLVFIDKIKELFNKNTFLKNEIYLLSNYLILISTKQTVNSNYLKIRAIKNNFEEYKKFDISYNKYKKVSAKINKNILICLNTSNNKE